MPRTPTVARSLCVSAVMGLSLIAAPRAATAADAHPNHGAYAIVVGYNGVPMGADSSLSKLKYADDDAVAIFETIRDFGARAILLTEPDHDTQVYLSPAASAWRRPTLANLESAIGELNAQMSADRAAGIETSLLIYYSGHGQGGATPSLTLAEGALTPDALYRDILPALTADVVHLVVDACHAEDVVRPRDVIAATVATTAADTEAFLSQRTLRAYPHVGAVLAASATKRAHEWDALRGGILTHEIISAFRGAADVNDDGDLEYSELAAFLSAANRGVVDARARLDVLVAPPAKFPHAPLVRVRTNASTALLQGDASSLGILTIEDESGLRLASLHSDIGHNARLVLPSARKLFLRSKDSEAELSLKAGETRRFSSLSFFPLSTKSRGAVESALSHGLFERPYGRAYYLGFVDSHETYLPVENPSMAAATSEDQAPPPRSRVKVSYLLWGASGVLTLTAGIFAGLAWDAHADYSSARYERDSAEASGRFSTWSSFAIGTGGLAAASAILAYLFSHEDRR